MLKVYARSTNIVERLVNTFWSAKSLYVVERSLVGVAGAAKPRVHRSISYWPCCCLLVAGCWLLVAFWLPCQQYQTGLSTFVTELGSWSSLGLTKYVTS